MNNAVVLTGLTSLLLYAIASSSSFSDYFDYEYRDPYDFNPCSSKNSLELEEIKDDVLSLRSLVEGLHQKLDPHLEMTAEKESKGRPQCPRGFKYLPGAHSCYKAISIRHEWSSAVEQCQNLNPDSHLASINSPEENEAVTKYLKEEFATGSSARSRCHRPMLARGHATFWTSGQRVNTSDCGSEFVWKTQTERSAPLGYSNWGAGEPNCDGGDEKCAELILNGKTAWNDVMCHVRCCPLCEFGLR